MKNLRSYKRLEKTKEDHEYATAELNKVLSKYSDSLEEKITECILHSYHNSLMEINRRKLVDRAKSAPPRIEFFVNILMNYSLAKLSKGDRLKAYEVIEKLKNQL